MPGRLILEEEHQGELRHTLDGKPVWAGQVLEVQLEDGSWLPGVYSGARGRPQRPWLGLRLGESLEIAVLMLPKTA